MIWFLGRIIAIMSLFTQITLIVKSRFANYPELKESIKTISLNKSTPFTFKGNGISYSQKTKETLFQVESTCQFESLNDIMIKFQDCLPPKIKVIRCHANGKHFCNIKNNFITYLIS